MKRGCQNGQASNTVPGGIPGANSRTGEGRANAGGTGKEFEPTAQTIYNWVAQADRDAGVRHDGLTTAERQELTRLRRENRQLEIERDILSQAAAWFARETGTVPDKGTDS